MMESSMRNEVSATLSSSGRVVIPMDVRRRLGLVEGSVLRFHIDDEGVRLLPPPGDVKRLKGRLKAPAKPVTVEEMSATILQRRSDLGHL
jgi:AbrB family looped-hinge helix DNA binding protein